MIALMPQMEPLFKAWDSNVDVMSDQEEIRVEQAEKEHERKEKARQRRIARRKIIDDDDNWDFDECEDEEIKYSEFITVRFPVTYGTKWSKKRYTYLTEQEACVGDWVVVPTGDAEKGDIRIVRVFATPENYDKEFDVQPTTPAEHRNVKETEKMIRFASKREIEATKLNYMIN